jgi:hypothetical protein
VDGYTVTLIPAYADANRVVISITVSGGLFESYPLSFVNWVADGESIHPRLTDEAGHEFPWLDGWTGSQLNGRGREHSLPIAQQTPTHVYAYHELALAFDTSAMEAAPDTLRLHLTLDLGSFGEAPFKVAGPFTFNFQMPFEAGQRVAPVAQTVVGPRGHLTLTQVRISQHEARAYLRFEGPDTPVNAPFTLQPATMQDIRFGVDGASAEPGDVGLGWTAGEWTYSRYDALLDSGTDWTLTVPAVQQAGADWRDVQGPWTFHFQVPPVGATSATAQPMLVYGLPTLLPPTPTLVWYPPIPLQTAYPTLPPPVPSVPARPR